MPSAGVPTRRSARPSSRQPRSASQRGHDALGDAVRQQRRPCPPPAGPARPPGRRGRQGRDQRGDGPSDATGHPMAHDGSAHRLAHDQADARRSAPPSSGRPRRRQQTRGHFVPRRVVWEVSRGPHAVGGGEHAGSGRQALAALGAAGGEDGATGAGRIRARKPWVFARRRVLGWNVRFMVWLLDACEGKTDPPRRIRGRRPRVRNRSRRSNRTPAGRGPVDPPCGGPLVRRPGSG